MDYITFSMTRIEARNIANFIRTSLGYDYKSKFNPIYELDRIHLIFSNISYEIIEDDDLPKNVHCVCEIYEDDEIIIKIKNYIYLGAVKRGVGGYLMDITHEIAHAILYCLGYKPISYEIFNNESIPAYKSAEWQAKAVAGEIMIPFEASKNMDIFDIVEKFNVSFDAASNRLRLNQI